MGKENDIVMGMKEVELKEGNQVGLAVLDFGERLLQLFCFVETTRFYQKTANLLKIYEPAVIVVLAPDGMARIAELLKNFPKVAMGPKAFDAEEVAQILSKLEGASASEVDDSFTSASLDKDYYEPCFAAAAAKIKWAEAGLGYDLQKSSLKVTVNGTCGQPSAADSIGQHRDDMEPASEGTVGGNTKKAAYESSDIFDRGRNRVGARDVWNNSGWKQFLFRNRFKMGRKY